MPSRIQLTSLFLVSLIVCLLCLWYGAPEFVDLDEKSHEHFMDCVHRTTDGSSMTMEECLNGP